MTFSLLIVVPTLNSHPLLPRLLRSLQEQSWPHWQLLFVDGFSGSAHRQWLQRCCAHEPRCRWIEQDLSEDGIFGAMNQGFIAANPSDWILFWGSDDWAASPEILGKLMIFLEDAADHPDILVCRGRYADFNTGILSRSTAFQPEGLLSAAAYRRSLLLGSTPPHQATLYGPGARQRLARYDTGFRLSADLDYFLQLSNPKINCSCELRVQCLDLELVHMANGGVSCQQTWRRLQEVKRSYKRAFGWLWWLPFIARYLKRIASLVATS